MVNQQERNNQRKGAIMSFVFHVALFLLALMPLLTFPDPPPGQPGVAIAFGEIETGQGEVPSSPPAVEEQEKGAEEAEPEKEPEREKPKPEPVKEEPKKAKEPTKSSKDVLTDKQSKEIALKKKKEREKKAREEAKERERDAAAKAKRDKEAAEKAAREKAAAEAKAAADAKAAAEAAAKAKKEAEAQKFRDLSSGLGSSNSSGNEGRPDGDPDGKALDGLSTGSGEIGGGLDGRDLTYRPKITDNSQKTGDVVVKVCVNADGKVTSAKYTQGGSTTTNASLIQTAVKFAKKYRFEKGAVDKQCGTIKIKFRLK